MPTLAAFFGITITMNFRDHPPPHFHARHGGQQATFHLDGTPLAGALSKQQNEHVLAWAIEHATDLERAWDDCVNGRNPGRIG